jgi:probable rRNA maturation factor
MLAFSIAQTTKGTLPRVPFKRIASEILGQKGRMTLIFVTPREAKRLNMKYRQKDYVPNVLTFPLSTRYGEIVICPQAVRKSMKDFDLSYTHMTLFLFIHGLLHLKGAAHSATMERLEERLFQKYRR